MGGLHFHQLPSKSEPWRAKTSQNTVWNTNKVGTLIMVFSVTRNKDSARMSFRSKRRTWKLQDHLQDQLQDHF